MGGFPAMQGELGCAVVLMVVGVALLLPHLTAPAGSSPSLLWTVVGAGLAVLGLLIVGVVLWGRRRAVRDALEGGEE